MRNRILGYGVGAGLVIGVPLFIMMVTTDARAMFEGGMLLGYTVMLVAFSLVFLAIKRQRDVDGGGAIRFWPALKLGLGISVVASLTYALAWEGALAVSGADFAGAYADHLMNKERAAGASAARLAQLRAEMDAFAQSYANPLVRVPMTFIEMFPVGLLVSLVSAALLRNPRFMAARRQRSEPHAS